MIVPARLAVMIELAIIRITNGADDIFPFESVELKTKESLNGN